MGKTDGRVQSRRRCAMKNPDHRIERLERNAAVAGANAAICVLVAAPAGAQIRSDLDVEGYVEANRRPGQRVVLIDLTRTAADGRSQ